MHRHPDPRPPPTPSSFIAFLSSILDGREPSVLISSPTLQSYYEIDFAISLVIMRKKLTFQLYDLYNNDIDAYLILISCKLEQMN